MARQVGFLGKLSINSRSVTPDNTGHYMELIGNYVDRLVDIIAAAPEDNVAPAAVNSFSIIQNSVEKKQLACTNTSNLIDNPAFEVTPLFSTFDIATTAGGSWDRIDPFEVNPSWGGSTYQGRYVCRYDTTNMQSGEDAYLYGTGDMGNVDEYNAGVIQAQQGEIYTFSTHALMYSGSTGSPIYNMVQAFMEFRDKDGDRIGATLYSDETFSPGGVPVAEDTWITLSVANKTVLAGTSYIVVGLKVLAHEGWAGRIYYFDGARLENVAGKLPGGYYGGTSFIGTSGSTITHSAIACRTVNWFSLPNGWTSSTELDFINDGFAAGGGADPAIEYTGLYPIGMDTRRFLVTWNYLQYGAANVAYWSMLGRIVKDEGSGRVEVPGSQAWSGGWWYFQVAYAHIWQLHYVSGSCIVKLSKGDKIYFEYGHYNTSGLSTFNAVNTYSLSPVSIQMTPVDD